MLSGLVHNASLLISLVVVHEVAQRLLDGQRRLLALVSGLLFGLMGVLVMTTPVTFAPGLIYDGRSIVLTLAGLFGGPLPGAIAAVFCGAYRLYLGGDGAMVGTAVVVASVLLGCAAHYLWRRDDRWVRWLPLLGLGLVVHVVMLALQLALPGGTGWDVLRKVGLPVIIGFPLTFLLTAQVFLEGRRRRQVVARIASSENRYRSLFEKNNAVMLLIDPRTGIIADANPAAVRFYGFDRDMLASMPIADLRLATPRDLENGEGSALNSVSTRHRLAGGEVRDVECLTGHLTIDDRELVYEIVLDVTERNLALRRVEQQRTMLARTEAMAHVGSWDWEIATDHVTWSEELFRIFGLEPAAEAPSFAEHQAAYLPEDRALLLAAVQRCMDDGIPYDDLEVRLRRPDGTIRTCLVSGVATRDADGRIDHLAGSLHDITERKQAEEALARSHALLENLARLVPGVIYQYRLWPGGRSAFPYSSPGMNLIYEVSPDDVREDATPVFARLHPDDADEVSRAIVASAESLETFFADFRVILPEQGLRWRWSRAEPQALDDGSVLWHGIILDVTERKLAELEQEKLRGQLIQAQKMESVGRLAGGVAHDFNNMLNVILGHAELALDDLADDHPLRDHLEQIIQSAQRSADLTRQLLAFARKQAAAPCVLELGETIASLLKMISRLIGEDVELVWRPSSDPTWVYVDPAQVDQVLANLCVNARDAIGDGHGTIVIETDLVTLDEDYCKQHEGFVPGEYVMLAVSDDGSGMDSEIVANIFEPFFTTKSPGKGTGLGLATVYGIVKQNRGFINVYSEPDNGSTFRVYWPRHQASEAGSTPSSPPPKPGGGQETILVVEDEEATLEITQVMLQRLGYTVLTASTPADALRQAMCHENAIDLLVTDVIMPEMNGRDLVAQALEYHPGLAYIFMSGYTADIIARQGVLDSGIDFIQKPFSAANLAAKVREVLDRPRSDDGQRSTS